MSNKEGKIQSLTLDVPQCKVSVVGGFGCQREIKAMSRLRFISVHYADGVNELEKETERDVNKPAAYMHDSSNHKCC